MSQDPLEQALNVNRARLIKADWSAALSKACEAEISSDKFLSVNVTVELKSAFFENLHKDKKTIQKHFWPKSSFHEIESYLSAICDKVESMQVILFSNVDKSLGAVILPAKCILEHAKAVWAVVGEDLCLTTQDLNHGMCLEENFYGDTGEYIKEGIYELSTWGIFTM